MTEFEVEGFGLVALDFNLDASMEVIGFLAKIFAALGRFSCKFLLRNEGVALTLETLL